MSQSFGRGESPPPPALLLPCITMDQLLQQYNVHPNELYRDSISHSFAATSYSGTGMMMHSIRTFSCRRVTPEFLAAVEKLEKHRAALDECQFLAGFTAALFTTSPTFPGRKVLHVISKFVPGPTLADKLRQNQGSLPEKTVRRYVKHILTALDALHRVAGVCHHGLNLDTIVIDSSAQVSFCKLEDVGYAAKLDSVAWCEDNARFCAPEQLSNPEQCSCAVDIWQVGVIAFKLLTGRYYPVDVPASSSSYSSSVSKEAQSLVDKMLSLNPADRGRADELLAHPFFTATAGNGQPRRGSGAAMMVPPEVKQQREEMAQLQLQDEIATALSSIQSAATAGPLLVVQDELWIYVTEEEINQLLNGLGDLQAASFFRSVVVEEDQKHAGQVHQILHSSF